MAADEVTKRDKNYIPTIIGLTNDANKYITVLKFDTAQERALVDSSTPPPSTAPVSGQIKVAATGTAIQFPSHTLVRGVSILANPDNSGAVTIGPSSITNTVDGTGSGAVLYPGASVSIEASNTSLIYLNGTIGDWVTFIAN